MLSRGRKIRNHFNGGSKEGKSLRYHFPSWEYPRSCHLKKKKIICDTESGVHWFISFYISL